MLINLLTIHADINDVVDGVNELIREAGPVLDDVIVIFNVVGGLLLLATLAQHVM